MLIAATAVFVLAFLIGVPIIFVNRDVIGARRRDLRRRHATPPRLVFPLEGSAAGEAEIIPAWVDRRGAPVPLRADRAARSVSAVAASAPLVEPGIADLPPAQPEVEEWVPAVVLDPAHPGEV